MEVLSLQKRIHPLHEIAVKESLANLLLIVTGVGIDNYLKGESLGEIGLFQMGDNVLQSRRGLERNQQFGLGSNTNPKKTDLVRPDQGRNTQVVGLPITLVFCNGSNDLTGVTRVCQHSKVFRNPGRGKGTLKPQLLQVKNDKVDHVRRASINTHKTREVANVTKRVLAVGNKSVNRVRCNPNLSSKDLVIGIFV
jgi:hypothetical protein